MKMHNLLFVFLIVIPCYWYGGNGDGYLGKRHAASWHGETPKGFPEVVDIEHLGIALNGVPFGEVVRVEIVGVPKWAKEEYSHLIGRSVYATVVDRTSDLFVDCWPATAKALYGKDYQRVGKMFVKIKRRKEWLQNNRSKD